MVLKHFKYIAKLAILLICAKKVKNWPAKYAKFCDIDNLILNLKICIGYKNIKINKKLEIEKLKEIMTSKRAKFLRNSFIFLTITLLINNNNNMFYVILTYKTQFHSKYRKKIVKLI